MRKKLKINKKNECKKLDKVFKSHKNLAITRVNLFAQMVIDYLSP